MSTFNAIAASIVGNLGNVGEIKFEKALTSAVTTSWGVGWDEDFIARDLMQNFYDANRAHLDQVLVKTLGSSERDIAVTSPTGFNLERLFYLGSEKGDDSVGQYGEGFKAAAVCLLRDHGVTPIAVSGSTAVVLRVSQEKVKETQLSPVVYDFYSLENEFPGTALILPGCSQNLCKAMKAGLSHFFYDGNELLGPLRWTSEFFQIYDSKTPNGHVFYRNLKRGVINDIPLVLVINKEYQNIEKKISNDRDRKAFGDEVMDLFFDTFAKKACQYSRVPEKVIVSAAKPIWRKGHPLLAAIAKTYLTFNETMWSDADSQSVFGVSSYFAKSTGVGDPAMQLSVDSMEKDWLAHGQIQLPSYFRAFGLDCAVRKIQKLRADSEKEDQNKNKRVATLCEKQCMDLLEEVLKSLSPAVLAQFRKSNTTYTVILSDKVLGELKSGLRYRSREVFLSADLFVGDFARAMATYLHEHAHIFGHDGDRGFTDALTEMFEELVRKRSEMDSFEETWNSLVEKVLKERTEHEPSLHNKNQWLQELDAETMRNMLAKLPSSSLNALRKTQSSLGVAQ